jgi:hypothetical protein
VLQLFRRGGPLLSEHARQTLKDVATTFGALALLTLAAGLARIATQGPFPWN